MSQNYHSFPYAGVGVPSESPFFPVITSNGGDIQAQFNQGYVIDFETITTDGTATVIKVSDMDQPYTLAGDEKFYVKVDASKKGAITASFSKQSPTNTGDEDIFYIKACEFKAKKISEIVLRENIHWRKSSGETIYHPWKVTPVVAEGSIILQVQGSYIHSNGVSLYIANTAVNGETGFVYLKIDRDASSRAITAGTVEFAADLPTNYYSEQYVPLAYVTPEKITQLTFEEIRIHELMIVDNGEFKLAPFQLSSLKIYDPQA